MSYEERRWMRHLSSELSEAKTEALRQAASRDAALAEQLERCDNLWERLDGPPERPVDGAFSQRVVEAARRIGDPLTWRQAPTWVRLGAAASLLLGITLGSAVSAQDTRGGGPMLDESAVEDLVFASPGLADGYWTLLDEPQTWGDPADPDLSSIPSLNP